jgi:hypothetical protein
VIPLNRKYGLACDNLIAADVVSADGRLLKASSEENDDLFWGLRGGGGNFGVVTALEYRLHPVGPVLGGELIFPLDRAKETLRFYRDWSTAAPDEVSADATLLSGPDGPALAIIVCCCGSIDRGEKVLRPPSAVRPSDRRHGRSVPLRPHPEPADGGAHAGFPPLLEERLLSLVQ